jgi:TonB-dependent starch-binding outer membrane protein SusC
MRFHGRCASALLVQLALGPAALAAQAPDHHAAASPRANGPPRAPKRAPMRAPSGLDVDLAPWTVRVARPEGEVESTGRVLAGTVRGRVVVGATGAPVASAQVSLAGRGTLTNDAGEFSFANVPAGAQTLQVRMLGYAPATRPVAVVDGQTADVTVALERQALNLDQVVVTGTAGAARRREVGNSIAQVDVAALPEVPPTVDGLLQGRAAGLTVTQNSGGVGGGASIRLRGNVSATQSNQPLIYVDGVRVKNDGFPKNTFPTGYSGNSDNTVYSPLNDIDPADIERVEVIKGAAATTLYGTEAAAGVVQIFTKRGRTGATQWTFQTDQSWSVTPKFGPTRGFDGEPLVVPPNEVNPYGTVDYAYLDPWLRTGHRQKYSLSLDGGREDVKYFIAGSWNDGTGVLPLDEESQKSVRGNVTLTPHKALTVQWNTSFSTNDLQKTPAGGTAAGLSLNASRRDRNYFGSADPAQIGRVLDFELTSQVDHLVTGTTISYQPREDLSGRLILGYDLAMQEARNYMPFGFATVPKGQLSDSRYSSRTLTADYSGTWSRRLSRSLRTSLSAGAQAVSVDQVNVTAASRDFSGPGRQTVTNGAVGLGLEERIKVINAGFFVQDVLDVADRYFLTTGVRFDGNSAFGQSLGLQAYPKVSGSWVASDESWWPGRVGTLKLRAAYGQSGRAPGAFDAVRTWDTYSWGGTPAFVPRNLGNPELGPERTGEVEAGFEGATLGGRLSVDFTWYRRTTSDALFAARQAPSDGRWGSQLENVGKLRSGGVELTLNGNLVQRAQFGWDAGLTVSTNHSKVLSLGGAAPFSIANNGWVVEGQPVPVIRGFCVANPDEYADPIRKPNCDYGPNTPTRTVVGSTSFALPFRLNLSARGEYQGNFFGYSLLDGEAIVRGIRWPSCFNAYPAIDRKDLSQVTAAVRARCISSNAIRDYAIFPLDFFRLRDVTLRRPIPLRIGRASSAVLTLSAQNLFWWKKAKESLLDPETSGGFTTGNTGMSQQVRSVGGSVPLPRTFLASVRLVY